MPHKLDPRLLQKLFEPSLSLKEAIRFCNALYLEEMAEAFGLYKFAEDLGIDADVSSKLQVLVQLITETFEVSEENRKGQLEALFPYLDRETVAEITERDIEDLNSCPPRTLMKEFCLSEEEVLMLSRWAQYKHRAIARREEECCSNSDG